jgi:hypothetical protein
MISINNTTDSVSAGVELCGYGPSTNAGLPFFFYEGFLLRCPNHLYRTEAMDCRFLDLENRV